VLTHSVAYTYIEQLFKVLQISN